MINEILKLDLWCFYPLAENHNHYLHIHILSIKQLAYNRST
jgi:hypothetical protein